MFKVIRKDNKVKIVTLNHTEDAPLLAFQDDYNLIVPQPNGKCGAEGVSL